MTAIARKIWVDIAGLMACAAMFYVANTGRYIGKSVSIMFPCTDGLADSFPCYGIIDMWVMALVVLIGSIFLIRLLVTATKHHAHQIRLH